MEARTEKLLAEEPLLEVNISPSLLLFLCFSIAFCRRIAAPVLTEYNGLCWQFLPSRVRFPYLKGGTTVSKVGNQFLYLVINICFLKDRFHFVHL
jgi:hypothetical protein